MKRILITAGLAFVIPCFGAIGLYVGVWSGGKIAGLKIVKPAFDRAKFIAAPIMGEIE